MPQPLEILIFFDNLPQFEVPTNEAHREILVSAQVGDYIAVHINGQNHHGNVTEKALLQNLSFSWDLALFVQTSATPTHIETLLKRPA
ncbi:hypothetical protein KV580_11880 [Pseudomonas chlororaphis]|nr:hypothetical protein [Pseudomonas chlororaphis]